MFTKSNLIQRGWQPADIAKLRPTTGEVKLYAIRDVINAERAWAKDAYLASPDDRYLSPDELDSCPDEFLLGLR